jgi:hypothetical protein
LVATDAVGVAPDPVVAGVLGVLLELVPGATLPDGVVPVAAGAANVSETWNTTGNGQPPLVPLEAPVDPGALAPDSLAELRVTAVTPWIRCNCTIVWATLS